MGNEALQALSRKYFQGDISRPEYRLQRQKIIDEITGGRESNFIDDGKTTGSHTSDLSHSPASGQTSNILLKAGVISVAVFVVLILVYATI